MLKTGVRSFKNFRDAYTGSRAVVVGSGQTQYNYADLTKLGDPIFFINDSVLLPGFCKTDHFFFTHHPEMEKYFDLDVVYIWMKTIVNHFPYHTETMSCKSYVPVTVMWGGKDVTSFDSWVFDKDYMAYSGKLLGHAGSITTLLHFLWYCGFRSILGVGIQPMSYGAWSHDPRIFREARKYDVKASGFCPGLRQINKNQLVYMRVFGFDVTYVLPDCSFL